ncbi:hypothetical protein BURCENBC7_AP5937 [Burkholderia cenocepacia BC7]|nr:hypothetical protein BURCENK562V_C5998 [Burkholderia cenocepacia K56-2Valvano]ERI25255.1 hypothetical protein BURCENBC7_AP5937 [Burkholderia cenocepacia BC7]CDN59482.1 hypothetical protein I35_0959 [Burkholderia cenocepacia H111]
MRQSRRWRGVSRCSTDKHSAGRDFASCRAWGRRKPATSGNRP